MPEDLTANDEFNNISNSMKRIGLLIYSKMLHCPNLERLKGQLKEILDSEQHFKTVTEKIIERCNYFISNEKEQKFPCDEGNCIYHKELDKDLQQFHSRLERLTAEVSL